MGDTHLHCHLYGLLGSRIFPSATILLAKAAIRSSSPRVGLHIPSLSACRAPKAMPISAEPRAHAGHRPGEPVFRDKPGRLVVDYLGLAQELKVALAAYTESDGTVKTAIDQNDAVAFMR